MRPLLIASACLALAGCGQRGDLYLPTPSRTEVPPNPNDSTGCAQGGGGAPAGNSNTGSNGTAGGCSPPRS